MIIETLSKSHKFADRYFQKKSETFNADLI